MARKYTKVEHLITIIEERTKAGETYREIGASLGLTREEVRGAMHRHHAKERKLAAGYIPRPKGRPRKEPVSEEAKQYNEIVPATSRPFTNIPISSIGVSIRQSPISSG